MYEYTLTHKCTHTLPSKTRVSMTTVGSFFSQIILQKSLTVFGMGPNVYDNIPHTVHGIVYQNCCLTLGSNVCFRLVITLDNDGNNDYVCTYACKVVSSSLY